MHTPRAYHTATLLNNGKVLIVGGFPSLSVVSSMASAELYNPATGTFTVTGSLSTGQANHTATLLNNGMVLIAGGADTTSNLTASAELYNPATGSFMVTGSLNTARYYNTATLLNNGMVLIAGGRNSSNIFLANAELYNPATGTFTATGSLNTARAVGGGPGAGNTAALLNNGMVLIAGGYSAAGPLASAELYNPTTGSFTVTGSLNTARSNHSVTHLSNGMVLIAGGFTLGPPYVAGAAESYDPATGAFTVTGSLNTARFDHTATLLNNGMVLIAGGTNFSTSGAFLASAELYTGSSGGGGGGGSVSVTVTPASTTVPTFGTQQFSAAITGTTNTAVNWGVNCSSGGSACGAVSQTGFYTAPNSVPTRNQNGGSVADTVTVTAVSQASPTASGSASVTVVPPNQVVELAPVKLGTTGGNANDSSVNGLITTCCGGTLGSLVSRSGNQFILSNNHVLARSDSAAIGDSIIQPGLIDSNCNTTGTTAVAQLSQFFNLETGPTPKVDAALAQIVAGTVDVQGTILELGGTTSGGKPTDGPPHGGSGVAATVSRAVAKSGRSTGLTCSTILATNVTTSVQYQKGCHTGSTFTVNYTNQIDIAGGNFSAEGDSGSLIVTQDTADPVALLFSGSNTDTLGNPISDVVNALADPNTSAKPVFVGTSSTHPVAACSLPAPHAAMTSRLALQRVAPSGQAFGNATTILDLHAPELLAHLEVQAVGVGASLDRPGEGAILLFVTEGMTRTNLPAEIAGVRTRIIAGDLFPSRGILSQAESAAMEDAAGLPKIVTSVPDAEIARARGVHAKHVDELMQVAGVQGVGITSSADSLGEAALMIFLIRGVPHGEIPPVIDGLRTRLRESNRFRVGFGDSSQNAGCSLRPIKNSARPGVVSKNK
jgi:hypothetical protein